MAKRTITKRQAALYKTLQRKLNIEQEELQDTKGQSEFVNHRMKDNAMANAKSIQKQTRVYTTIH